MRRTVSGAAALRERCVRRCIHVATAVAVLVCGSYAAFAARAESVKVSLATGYNPFGLKAEPSAVKAGRTTFVVYNGSRETGLTELHNLVVLKTNVAPGNLPIDKTGRRVVETGRVGKPLLVKPGQTRMLTLRLTPGKYVLVCNLIDHYSAGMYAPFVVR